MSIALVTGAAGFLGGHLVSRLRDSGHTVRALVQNIDQPTPLAPGIEVHIGDITRANTLAAPLGGAKLVFHCAARLPGKATEVEIWDTNVEGTRTLLEACADAGVARVVFVSTDSVYGDGHQPGASEMMPLHPEYLFEDNYPRSKAAGEVLVREAGERRGLATTILRTCMIYGPGASTGSDFLRWWAAKRLHLLVDGGRARISMIYVSDLVDAMLLAATTPAAAGQVYNVSSGSYRVREVLATSARVTGRSKFFVTLPAVPTRFVCRLLHPLAARFSTAAGRRLEPRRVDFLVNDHVMDCSKAAAELGFHPAVGLEEGLARTLTPRGCR